MKPQVFYETVTEAIKKLRAKGFTLDFNLGEDCIHTEPNTYSHDDFDVVEIYRYEGNTDPADEATVYGIVCGTGEKGILVTGYGAFTETASEEILRKLRF